MKKCANVFVFILMVMTAGLNCRADNGTEFGVEDDLTVWGTQGSTADADVEIKGFTVFGSTTANNLAVYSGTGSVFMGGALEVSSNTYLRGSVVVGTTASQGIFAVNDNFVATSGGNVGIGTTNPGAKLHIYGPGAGVTAQDSGGSNWLELYSDGAVIAKTGSYLRFGHASGMDASGWSEKMRIDSSGNIGIGTTGPNYKLEVQGGYVGVTDAETNSGTLRLGALNGVPGVYSFTTLRLQSNTGYNVLLNPDPGNGNVGIGTAGPAYKLEVVSDSYPEANFQGSGAAAGISLKNTGTGGRNWYLWALGPGSVQGAGKFSIYDTIAGDRLTIDTSGNVGIGTTNPAGPLDVYAGGASALNITGAGVVNLPKQPGAGVYLGSDQLIPDNIWTKVSLDSENWDVGGKFDTANYRYAPGAAGYYLVTANVYFSSLPDGGQIQIGIFKNGAAERYIGIRGVHTGTYAGGDNAVSGSTVIHLDAADYIELYVHNYTGGARYLIHGRTYTWMEIQKIS